MHILARLREAGFAGSGWSAGRPGWGKFVGWVGPKPHFSGTPQSKTHVSHPGGNPKPRTTPRQAPPGGRGVAGGQDSRLTGRPPPLPRRGARQDLPVVRAPLKSLRVLPMNPDTREDAAYGDALPPPPPAAAAAEVLSSLVQQAAVGHGGPSPSHSGGAGRQKGKSFHATVHLHALRGQPPLWQGGNAVPQAPAQGALCEAVGVLPGFLLGAALGGEARPPHVAQHHAHHSR